MTISYVFSSPPRVYDPPQSWASYQTYGTKCKFCSVDQASNPLRQVLIPS